MTNKIDHKLTRSEADVWFYILAYLEDHKVMPTLIHLADHFKWANKSASYKHVRKLILKGYLERVPKTEFRRYRIKK